MARHRVVIRALYLLPNAAWVHNLSLVVLCEVGTGRRTATDKIAAASNTVFYFARGDLEVSIDTTATSIPIKVTVTGFVGNVPTAFSDVANVSALIAGQLRSLRSAAAMFDVIFDILPDHAPLRMTSTPSVQRLTEQSSGLSSVEQPMSAVITHDGEACVGDAATVMVGERVHLGIASEDLEAVEHQCYWFVRGPIVTGYAADYRASTIAFLSAAQLREKEVDLHWLAAGSYRVDCVLLVNARWIDLRPVSFTVTAPTCDLTAVMTDVVFSMFEAERGWTVGLGVPWQGAADTVRIGASDVATLQTKVCPEGDGDVYKQLCGIYFTGSVNDNKGDEDEGSWGFVQLAKHTSRDVHRGKFRTGSEDIIDVEEVGSFGWALDAMFPYTAQEDTEEADLELNDADGEEATCADSPHYNLATAVQSSMREDHFRMFVLYKSQREHSIFVPLAILEWGWQSSVGRTSAATTSYSWTFTARDFAWLPHGAAPGGPGNRRYATVKQSTTYLPVWEGNATTLRAMKVKRVI